MSSPNFNLSDILFIITLGNVLYHIDRYFIFFVRCFGCLMVYTLGYFMRWNRIAIFALGVPVIACLVALATASESPVYLVAQNKVFFDVFEVEYFCL